MLHALACTRVTAVSAPRIDGLLFINLTNDDWPDMGIVNKFHAKKLSLILKSYRCAALCTHANCCVPAQPCSIRV